MLIAGVVALLTWFVPAGKYESLTYSPSPDTFHVTSRESTASLPATQATLESLGVKIPVSKFKSGDIYKPISIPNTYHKLEARPQGFMAFAQSPVKGVIAAADIIFLILIIGGLIGIMNRTGAFDAGIAWLAHKLKGREYMLIVLVTSLVAAGGTTFGLAEETMAFYPILIPIFLAAGYDALVGVACIFVGSTVGIMFSTINPFATIIASNAAGINWTVGLNGRLLMLLLGLLICVLYILRYAKRVKADPAASLIYEQRDEINALFSANPQSHTPTFTHRLRLILVLFSASFVVMIVGVSMLEWWFVEMTATFLVGAIAIGFVARMRERDFVEAFSKGAGDLLSVAFIVGIARGITLLLEDGLISDTILYHASTITEDMNKGVFASAMLFIYAGLSFFMPSSSGMAVLTMPILSPLADTVGIGREVVVNAYLYGMGLFNFINPTGLILAALAIVKFGFDKWLLFVMPLFLILLAVALSVLTLSVYL